MKALILAAGFGTRLRPFTDNLPKPLFPVGGVPVLLRMIRALEAAGCTEIAINTHHLGEQIQDYVDSQNFSIPVTCHHEPEILGTGGAIKNLEHMFWDAPFLVVNGDTLSDVNFAELYRFHDETAVNAATLVLHDYPQFNTVLVDGDKVLAFMSEPEPDLLAFTGIQVIDPAIFDFLEPGQFQSSITAYEKMTVAGLRVGVWIPEHIWWHDMGSFQGLSRACLETGALQLFAKEQTMVYAWDLSVEELAGGGSTRQWYRLGLGDQSMVAVDHGLADGENWNEADAYHAIGNHLLNTGAPVPKILAYDRFAGTVFAQDLGDTSLDHYVQDHGIEKAVPLYEQVIRDLAAMACKGLQGFDKSWTFHTREYDKDLILQFESRYFFEAFINGYLKNPAKFEDYLHELEPLAEKTVQGANPGFLHRDFQSRNIMVKNGACHFIDFQGGRIGPVQYDLASVLIDPYTSLPQAIQDHLLKVYMEALSTHRPMDETSFLARYKYCALHRNLQMLGAFAHLTMNVQKPGFAEFIRPALLGLKERIKDFPEAPKFLSLVESLPVENLLIA